MDLVICTRRIGWYIERNILEDLEAEVLEYETAKKILAELKKEFGEEEETVKVAKLGRMEQGEKMIEEFVQEFKRVARESRYEGRLLIVEFK